MTERTITADYVIAGAGAVGLAFADAMLTCSHATMVIVDRRANPGGHWNDAYPFVRLHGPSAVYGVDSMPLGSDRVDTLGLNRGLHELASGAELCAYFQRVMHERLLASGRVCWLPLHELGPDGVAHSLLDGRRVCLRPRRRWVDATVADTQVPATHAAPFAVADGVRLATPAGITQLAAPADRWVIVGGGKTAMDTALWLLAQGVDADAITWIRPRESWLLNRERMQPTSRFLQPLLRGQVIEMEAARDARTLPELFRRLEDGGQLLRIDPEVEPTMYRCAIVSLAELAQLRRIRQVVRAGHVRAIERGRIVLDRGTVPTSTRTVHVHCASRGLPRRPLEPVFQRGRIVPQYVRRCSPSFSAAFVARVEATVGGGDALRNALCEPVPVPREPLDWLRIHLASARNQQQWTSFTALQGWMRGSRTEAYQSLLEHAERQSDPVWREASARLREARPAALRRLQALVCQADAEAAAGARLARRTPPGQHAATAAAA